jgi:hypothetical protein
MISENYESRERLMAWDVPAIAGDREAVKAVLQEYLVRLMFEDNDKMSGTMAALLAECVEGAVKEFNAAPINKRVTPEPVCEACDGTGLVSIEDSGNITEASCNECGREKS